MNAKTSATERLEVAQARIASSKSEAAIVCERKHRILCRFHFRFPTYPSA